MSRFLALVACLTAVQVAVRADESITPETIDLVKKASVFVRVEGEGWSATGSGFVVVSDEKKVLIATNRHVAVPIAPTAPEGKGAKITVVFDSGSKTERSYTGTVVGTDSERDLAVLRVTGVKDAPRPISYEEVAKPTETMQVFTFGFPFGKALATNKGSPAITVGKASISSLRNGPDGELSIIQIDGNLNPGNSGGPVVDSKGRLVGIAVATIRDGQGIGLTIPAADLGKLMQGRVGRVRFTRNKSDSDSTTIRIEADLLDPIENLRSATAHYFVVSPKTKRPETEALDKHPGSKKIELKIEKGVAVGEFKVAAVDGELLIQVMAAPADKAALATKPRVISLKPLPKLSDFAGSPPAGWKEYSPKDNTYTMWVPEKPDRQTDGERILLARRERIRVNTMAGRAESGLIYEAQSIALPISFGKVPQKDLYDMFQGSVVAAKKGRVMESKETELGGKPATESLIEADGVVTRLRMSCTDLRVYIVMVTGEADQVTSAEAEMFLSSYRPPTVSVAGPKVGKEPTIIGGVNAPMFKDLAPEKGFLIGLEIGLANVGNEDVIKAIRPIFRVGDKERFGAQHGTQLTPATTIKAKDGYAVGAITYKSGVNIEGCSLTFMKVVDGKLNPKESYESDWVGFAGKKTSSKIEGDGTPVVGIAGRGSQKEVNGLGLVFMGQEGFSLGTPVRVKDPTILGGAFDPEFKDLAPADGLLVGFEIGLGRAFNRDMIRAARPIYRVGDKETFGEQHGTQVKTLITLKAKEGYAVGAISVKHGLGFDGMSLTFMKVVDGKLDPKDSYESEFVGTDENKIPTIIGGDGTLVIGIVGKSNNKDMTGMGLLFTGQEGYEPKKKR